MRWPRLLALTALLLVCVSLVHALDQVRNEDSGLTTVQGSIKLARGVRASDARVLLNGGQYVGLVRVDGTFVITDVRPGSHLLEVVNLNEWLFEPVRLDISARDKGKVRASPLNKPMERLAYPLVIRPLAKAQYFEQHQPWNWGAMLKNPMVIMLGIMALFMFVMPRMMSGMDPKELEEMKKMQANMSLSKLLSGAAGGGGAGAGGGAVGRRGGGGGGGGGR